MSSDKHNVIALFPILAKRQEAAEEAAAQAQAQAQTQSVWGEEAPASSFEDIMRQNAERQKRMQEARLKANQSVLRSYKIKK